MAIRQSPNPSKDGKKYYFDVYYDIEGRKKRYRSKLYLTKAEAKKAERLFLQSEHVTEYTFNEIIDSYIEFKKKNWKQSTYRAYNDIFNHIRYKLGSVYVSELTKAQYEAFLKYLDNLYKVVKRRGKPVKIRYSVRYKNTIVRRVKTICRYAELHYNVKTRIPFLYDSWKQDNKDTKVVITPESLQKLTSCVAQTPYRNLLIFLFYTGCRRGEALALQFKDVDFENKTINIYKSYSIIDKKTISPKTTSSIRTIPLSAKAYEAVLAMREYYGYVPSYYVFGGKRTLPCSSIERIKNKALRDAKLPHMRIHDFRHSFITMMVSKNADIGALAHYVGHASVKQTLDTYTHFYEDKVKAMVEDI